MGRLAKGVKRARRLGDSFASGQVLLRRGGRSRDVSDDLVLRGRGHRVLLAHGSGTPHVSWEVLPETGGGGGRGRRSVIKTTRTASANTPHFLLMP